MSAPLTVAWISDYPVERLPGLPEELNGLPLRHPLTWQRVLLQELQDNPGLEVHVLALRKGIPHDVTFQRNGVWFHVLKLPPCRRIATLFWLDTWIIRRALRKIQPQLVHSWGTERGAALVASRLGYPYLVTVQGLLSWLGELVPLEAYERLAALLERFSLPHAPVITTESSFAVEYLRKAYLQPKVIQIEHAPNWLFHKVQRQPQLKPFRFIFVGTLSYLKGTDLLLKALDALKAEIPFELILVGSPVSAKYFSDLKKMTSPELWQRIHHYNSLSSEEVARELALATLLLFPTRADNSPNSVKEAVAAGVPVVASRIGGIPEYVAEGKNGFMFKAGDLSEFSNRIKEACLTAPFSVGAVDPACLHRMRQYLSPAEMGGKFSALYSSLVHKNAR